MKQIKVFQCVFVAGAFALLLWGCPKKAEVSASPENRQEITGKEAAAPSTAPQPAETMSKIQEEGVHERTLSSPTGLKPIFFDFNMSVIRNDEQQVIRDNAVWLKAHPATKIRIEGNCDERGTKEYNQALGQRRAASAKKFLTHAGIAGSRISLISFGKERPVCSESSEGCWQKNRKDDFVVITK
ncbi:MAG TPA: peptidoglycan-associated lipoprotein Pal [Nitrospirota bacterium]|nr:peptidoglycan-associated lipoprotein Pal [Nitrospirota bacterium]